MFTVIRNIPSYEKIPFDRGGKHATGREVGEYVESTNGDSRTFCWFAEYEGDSTCELPTTDLVARVEALNKEAEGIDLEIRQAQYYGCSDLLPEHFGDEVFEELNTILNILYEYWADHVLMENGIDSIPEDMEQLFREWECELVAHLEVPFV